MARKPLKPSKVARNLRKRMQRQQYLQLRPHQQEALSLLPKSLAFNKLALHLGLPSKV